jgi:hypothetical protein
MVSRPDDRLYTTTRGRRVINSLRQDTKTKQSSPQTANSEGLGLGRRSTKTYHVPAAPTVLAVVLCVNALALAQLLAGRVALGAAFLARPLAERRESYADESLLEWEVARAPLYAGTVSGRQGPGLDVLLRPGSGSCDSVTESAYVLHQGDESGDRCPRRLGGG